MLSFGGVAASAAVAASRGQAGPVGKVLGVPLGRY
jgi:hypothetical protein